MICRGGMKREERFWKEPLEVYFPCAFYHLVGSYNRIVFQGKQQLWHDGYRGTTGNHECRPMASCLLYRRHYFNGSSMGRFWNSRPYRRINSALTRRVRESARGQKQTAAKADKALHERQKIRRRFGCPMWKSRRSSASSPRMCC